MEDDGFLIQNYAKKFEIMRSQSLDDDPVIVRPFHSGDAMNYEQVFMSFDWGWLEKIKDPKLIVDCGAYVGYTTYMFRQRFPGAYIVAVEPNKDNFYQLKRHAAIWNNTQRLEIVNRAVWPIDGQSIYCHLTAKGTNTYCERELSAIKKDDVTVSLSVKTINIYKILSWFRSKRINKIDILKIDIEGAEHHLFDPRFDLSWINNVRNICIELHSPLCRERFFKAMEPYDYKKLDAGEHVILKNIKKK